METTNKLTSFVKECLARFKGDTDEVIAQKNFRKASISLEQQIMALKSKEIEAEELTEKCKEDLEIAKYPTTLITDGNRYVENIKNALDRSKCADEALEDVKFSIGYFTGLLESYK